MAMEENINVKMEEASTGEEKEEKAGISSEDLDWLGVPHAARTTTEEPDASVEEDLKRKREEIMNKRRERREAEQRRSSELNDEGMSGSSGRHKTDHNNTLASCRKKSKEVRRRLQSRSVSHDGINLEALERRKKRMGITDGETGTTTPRRRSTRRSTTETPLRPGVTSTRSSRMQRRHDQAIKRAGKTGGNPIDPDRRQRSLTPNRAVQSAFQF